MTGITEYWLVDKLRMPQIVQPNTRRRLVYRVGIRLKMLNDHAQHICDRKLIRDDIDAAAQIVDGCRRDRPNASDRASIDDFAESSAAEKPDKIPHGARAREGYDIDFAFDEQARERANINAR